MSRETPEKHTHTESAMSDSVVFSWQSVSRTVCESGCLSPLLSSRSLPFSVEKHQSRKRTISDSLVLTNRCKTVAIAFARKTDNEGALVVVVSGCPSTKNFTFAR